MLVLHDEATLRHKTVEILGAKFINALECPERIANILQAVKENGQHKVLTFDAAQQIADDGIITDSLLSKMISDSHDAAYLTHLRTIHKEWVVLGNIKEDESVIPECFPVSGLIGKGGNLSVPQDSFARPGYFSFDLSAGVCKDTWLSACASANLAVEAARSVVSSKGDEKRVEGQTNGTCKNVLALCRPPGHHCTTRLAGGYCYINNAVVAVHALRHFGVKSDMAILDLDFHHGNGTQDYFYGDVSVLYVSLHGDGEYPYYSGSTSEIGEGSGTGFNVNLPLPVCSSITTYLDTLKVAIERLETYAPEYLIVSLGFDTFHLDPLGSFDLHTEHYEEIASAIRQAEGLRNVSSVILLEGGYVLDDLGPNILSFLRGWDSSS
ncbi:histone deacetylase superfamily [Grosmannia clavigera kw1407]|uniref:Histone deacetylase superfamily n=1 Tax=Grosmannia clavigera (strain kw1407 / UAMH 11150) TaxID=655863 RepID=F0XB88_GROCL|nr:histone deacetylase superfamily [Grosmannia clavigera kw1407]EFX05054.1 histone deacetylase superfamily [Grosmannia clavigera kw1407]